MTEFLIEWGALIVSLGVLIWSIISFILLNIQNKEMKKLQDKLDKRAHISAKQFDYEFEIFKSLSSQLYKTFLKVEKLFPMGLVSIPQNQDEHDKTIYTEAAESYNVYQELIRTYEAFMNYDIFEEFVKIGEKMKCQLIMFSEYLRDKNSKYEKSGKDHLTPFNGTEILSEMRIELMAKLRKYFEKLKETIE